MTKGSALPSRLVREEYSIGRGEENTVRLTERNISRKHARTEAQWLGLGRHRSRELQRLVRQRRPPRGRAHSSPKATSFRSATTGSSSPTKNRSAKLGRQRQRSDPPRRRPRRGQARPAGRRRRARAGRRISRSSAASISIGRAPELNICFPHSSVSRLHAEVHALGGGRYEIIDKASANGVRVNGSLLKRGLLEAGDSIVLGEVKLKFVGAGQAYRPGPEAHRLVSPTEEEVAKAQPSSTEGGTLRPPPAVGPGVRYHLIDRRARWRWPFQVP